jgi:hypothetical protein
VLVIPTIIRPFSDTATTITLSKYSESSEFSFIVGSNDAMSEVMASLLASKVYAPAAASSMLSVE